MNIIIGILDQHGNTDNIVLVDNENEQFLWIPRDLFSTYTKDRINTAYTRGGHSLFLTVIRKLEVNVTHSIVIPTETTAKVLANIEVNVPIKKKASYYYPKTLFTDTKYGKKIITFNPPSELLKGERIHQFLGARHRVNKNEAFDRPDFERIYRQMDFVKALFKNKFDFQCFLKEKIFISSNEAIEALKNVKPTYEYNLFHSCKEKKIGEKLVLIKKGWVEALKISFIKAKIQLKKFIKKFLQINQRH